LVLLEDEFGYEGGGTGGGIDPDLGCELIGGAVGAIAV